MKKTNAELICVQNSCRSQIAESLVKKLASNVFECNSAGTKTKLQINQDAVRMRKQVHGYSKHLAEPPQIVTMGCNVQCPFRPYHHREDRVLEDPGGREDSSFLTTLRLIMGKCLELKQRVKAGELQ